ncbi:MAG TPA: aspartate aminotransferase family protein [Chloroflexota bacterium]
MLGATNAVETTTERSAELGALDRAHQIHPQQLDVDHLAPVVFARGEGAILWDADGRRYLDGLSCLWNVNVGHGRRELATAAADQMATLAFANNYVGFGNEPAIRLAARLAELAPGDLNHVFFTTGGAESNESAFKLARFYWSLRGRPEKVKIISRSGGYHGVGMGAMAATGLPAYWTHFGPLPPGFSQVPAMSAEALEAHIQAEGPETVAAFIAEPVQGVAGVMPPPPDYFPQVRAICDRYDVLLIADEVITGFGRTGRYWGLQNWNVTPDILSFAKGVTSGYLPLGGIIFSERIRAEMRAEAQERFMHAYTYSGHPTCCAVGLRNLEIIEKEGLVARAAASGRRMLNSLTALQSRPDVVEVRGLGMMAAVEFRTGSGIAARALVEARRRGLITRFREEHLLLAPPLVTSEAELDEMTDIFCASVAAVADDQV